MFGLFYFFLFCMNLNSAGVSFCEAKNCALCRAPSRNNPEGLVVPPNCSFGCLLWIHSSGTIKSVQSFPIQPTHSNFMKRNRDMEQTRRKMITSINKFVFYFDLSSAKVGQIPVFQTFIERYGAVRILAIYTVG